MSHDDKKQQSTTNPNPTQEDPRLELCDELFEDDGPSALQRWKRSSGRSRRRRDRGARKREQLGAQIERSIHLSLSADFEDPMLAGLIISDVKAGTLPGRFEIWLYPSQPIEDEALYDELRERLEACEGYLRSQVAAHIHRKQAPELDFVLWPGPQDG